MRMYAYKFIHLNSFILFTTNKLQEYYIDCVGNIDQFIILVPCILSYYSDIAASIVLRNDNIPYHLTRVSFSFHSILFLLYRRKYVNWNLRIEMKILFTHLLLLGFMTIINGKMLNLNDINLLLLVAKQQIKSRFLFELIFWLHQN